MINELESISLPTRWLGQTWHYFPEIGSTNTWLKEHTDELAHGTVAITNYQATGKGRLGRTWVAPPNTSILHSLLLKPRWAAERANWFTMMAGIAAVEALRSVSAVSVQLKWPNDVVIVRESGEVCKLGGILLDGQFTANLLTQAIVGIGLNINLPQDQLPTGATKPTSLLVESGQQISRAEIVTQLLLSFEKLYERADAGYSPHEKWNEYLVNVNQPVTVTYIDNQDQLYGTAVGTTPTGHLLVRDNAGKNHEISAGDVTLRPSGE